MVLWCRMCIASERVSQWLAVAGVTSRRSLTRQTHANIDARAEVRE